MPKRFMTYPPMVYRSTLKKEWGFSDSMIEAMGDPDMFVDNPHGGSAASLYLLDRAIKFARDYIRKAEEERRQREFEAYMCPKAYAVFREAVARSSAAKPSKGDITWQTKPQ